MTDGLLWFIGAVCTLAAVGLIWVLSASTIAKECRMMGQFYVGETVYECKVKEWK